MTREDSPTWVQEIRDCQFEITSRCNAACPGCARNINPGELNPYFEANRDLPLELIRGFLEQPETKNLQSVLFNGNFGDPAAHPDLIGIVREIASARPDACIVMHTNGGLRTEGFWRDLAGEMNSKGRWVKFSIDGLADTNSIYRRNVVWEKVMTNARAFIEAGGRAAWKWVNFGHTRHQLEEARQLAEKLGFRKFEVRRENTGIDDYSKPLPRRETDVETVRRLSDDELDEHNRRHVSEHDLSTLTCRAKLDHSVFVDFNGKLWPCCWVAKLPHSRWLAVREHFLRREMKNYTEGFNDLRSRAIGEILAHPWFARELENGWNTEATCLSTCAMNCSAKQSPPNA